MSNGLLFVGGVHGVGKNTFCQKLSKALGYRHYSASDLIKEEKQALVDIDKVVVDPNLNQDCLIKAINKIPKKYKLLIDGHFCLQGTDGLFYVPKELFKTIKVSSIILLLEKAEIIRDRLLDRDQMKKSIEDIERFQKAEELRAIEVSNYINVPLYKTSSESMDLLIESLSQKEISKHK